MLAQVCAQWQEPPFPVPALPQTSHSRLHRVPCPCWAAPIGTAAPREVAPFATALYSLLQAPDEARQGRATFSLLLMVNCAAGRL